MRSQTSWEILRRAARALARRADTYHNTYWGWHANFYGIDHDDRQVHPLPAKDDRVVSVFLVVLENDLKKHPGRRTRLSKTSLARTVRLTRKVRVCDREGLPLDVTF